MNTRHEQVAEIDPNDSIFADDFEIIVDSDPMSEYFKFYQFHWALI